MNLNENRIKMKAALIPYYLSIMETKLSLANNNYPL